MSEGSKWSRLDDQKRNLYDLMKSRKCLKHLSRLELVVLVGVHEGSLDGFPGLQKRERNQNQMTVTKSI